MDQRLLDILVCPLCKGKLIFHPNKDELVCRFDKLAYPIRNGIPVMLADESRRLGSDEVIS